MDRPIIQLEKGILDWILDGINVLLLVALITLPIIKLSELPDQIPVHFSADGLPDGYGSKYGLWRLPVLGIGIFIALFFLKKSPHIFNYAVEITTKNAQKQYLLAVRMLGLLSVIILGSFLYIVHQKIQAALSGSIDLGLSFALWLGGTILFVLGVYIFLSLKRKSD
ncbi:DUF1648 domain-containing protein [Algoriphagus kandeliae]|uniref:DUF1648 domain-containing protein n=1 Tax=Algoriphagus kandeliae TaxID=2562278 RepID=A0A4Y9QTN0_9BACT|nr:DUF1648 domain-containing protein [Algoriphagus kandeliae]TFV95944.1 DUF1648 domain-containing protein [Algoriphagus kandeliae]